VISVAPATTDEDLDETRALFRSFVAWHRDRHVEDLRLVDGYFDQAELDAELAGLPGYYAAPEGRLLLARIDGEAAGCVALRTLSDGRCEMKRMFVYPEFQGSGVGRALGIAIVDAAREAGYRAMRLDTSVRQVEAQALYRSLGFRSIGAYYPLPQELVDWLVFLELDLSAETVS
jgi:GNAT superfamily N-acetyltransferase